MGYLFAEAKQAIMAMPSGQFRVITEHGKEKNLSKTDLLVYLCSNEKETIGDIQFFMKKQMGYDIDPNSLLEKVEEFIKDGLILSGSEINKFHPHYAFNIKKVIERVMTEEVSQKEKIITLGKVELSVTNECPFSCSYCSKKAQIMKEELLTLDEKKKILYDAYMLGANTMTLTGGEPLCERCFEDTLSLIRYGKELGFRRKVILTSGIGLSGRIPEIREAGVDEVQISYNGNQYFEEDRIRNLFIENNIQDIAKLNDYNIRLGICCVVTRENVTRFGEIIDFCLKNEIHSVYFYPVMPIGAAKQVWNELMPEPNLLRKAFEELKKYKEEYKLILNISAPQSFMYEGKYKQICDGGLDMVYVGETGRVAACACSELSTYSVKDNSLKWIWENAEYFEKFRVVKEYNEKCLSCTDMQMCVNTCYYRNKYLAGEERELFSTSELCTI